MDREDYAWLTATIFAISLLVSLAEMFWLTVVSRKESCVHGYRLQLNHPLLGLGTLQQLRASESPEFGITREVDSESWRDVRLGELAALLSDLIQAPGMVNKSCYLGMPPGWSHTGDHKTVGAQRRSTK